MKKLLIFLLVAPLWGQSFFSGIDNVTADPAGACAYGPGPGYFGRLQYNISNGNLWGCQANVWTLVTTLGGGGGGVSSVALSTNLGTVTGSPVTGSGTLTNTVSAAQVVSLFSGCSGVQYLGADGSCHSGSSGTVTSISTSNGITGGTITTTGTISGVNAAADGSTKGVSAFTANDFDASSGVISLDYTNGQKATGSQPGFLSSTDWTTFNGKGSGTVTSVATTSPITGGTITGTGTIACATCVTSAAALTANLPVFGSGSQATAVGSRSGNTTEVATVTGSLTSGNCLKADASGNVIDAGAVCGTGSGTVTNTGTLTANLPIIGNGGVDITTGTRSGNTTEFVTTTGSQVNGNCVEIDSNGNHISSSGPCFGGSGGVTITQGTYAALPATCATGSLYLITDSPISEARCSAANTWTLFLSGIGAVTPPVVGNFTWVNQSTATANNTYGMLTLTAQSSGAAFNINALVKSIPMGAYHAIACFSRTSQSVTNDQVGMVFRNSSSGKMMIFGPFQAQPFQWVTFYASAPTTYGGSTPVNVTQPLPVAPYLCLRIGDDNSTTRTYDIGNTTHSFYNIGSDGRTSQFTADQIGFFVNGTGQEMNIVHYEETP